MCDVRVNSISLIVVRITDTIGTYRLPGEIAGVFGRLMETDSLSIAQSALSLSAIVCESPKAIAGQRRAGTSLVPGIAPNEK